MTISITTVGRFFLSMLLFLLAFSYFGIWTAPGVELGIVAGIAAVCYLLMAVRITSAA